MEEKILVRSGVIDYNPYGNVKVNVRRSSRNISGRWKYGRLEVSVPYGLPCNELFKALEKWKDRFPTAEESRIEAFYHIGQRLDFEDFSVAIEYSRTLTSGRVGVCRGIDCYVVSVSRDLDIADPEVARTITGMIERVAHFVAPGVLIPMARREAERVGKYPTGWVVGRGHRVLGTCNNRGVISLSHCLLFVPEELRRYVICHELSHLSELNHSELFHRICDSYLGGREKELMKKFKDFKWPVYF